MAQSLSMHGSAFAYEGAGCLLLGDSGSGKSTLLAEALLHGAQMIADDNVLLHDEAGALMVQAPSTIAGVLELRGLGLIRYPHTPTHPIHLIVQLAGGGDERLPEPATQIYCGVEVPFIAIASPVKLSVAALLLYLKAVHEKRTLPTDWRPVG